MGDLVHSPTINFQMLLEFQDCFQKDLSELIDMYLSDSHKKFDQLSKALEACNFKAMQTAARELRKRSIDVGAIHFSHACLGLELALQEMRLERIQHFVSQLNTQFLQIEHELLRIKQRQSQPQTQSTSIYKSRVF